MNFKEKQYIRFIQNPFRIPMEMDGAIYRVSFPDWIICRSLVLSISGLMQCLYLRNGIMAMM